MIHNFMRYRVKDMAWNALFIWEQINKKDFPDYLDETLSSY